MANDKQICPICGTKLKMINGRMTCKDCGYYVREQNDLSELSGSSQTNSTIPPYGSVGQQTSPSQSAYTPGQPPQYQYAASNQTAQQAGSQTPRKKSNTAGIIAAVLGIAGVLAVLVFVVITRGLIVANQNSQSHGTTPSIDTDELIITDGAEEAADSSSEGNTSSSGGIGSDRYMPRSDFFRMLAEAIFGKPCASITREEFASVTALGFDTREQNIYYQLNYEMEGYLTYTNRERFDFTDLQYFPSLYWVSLEGDTFDSGDLRGLNYLSCVYSDNSLEELIQIIPFPDNIVELGFEASFFDDDLSGIEHFPNLEYLSVDSNRLTDISALADFPDLKGLSLLNCTSLMDYSQLMKMTNLEELTLQSSQLKTIEFIRQMPGLTYLRIEDSQITDVSALSSCPELTSLHLIENYSVTDYSPVGDLVHLKYLSLHKNAEAAIPSLANLTELESASFKNLWDGQLALVAAAPNITQLYLDNTYDDDLTSLVGLPLTSLTMIGGYTSISSRTLLSPLTELPLEYLNMTDLHVWGNIEEIFGIPTLRYLYMDEGRGVIDFDIVPTNENLLVLSMSGYKIDLDFYGDAGPQYLSDHYDFFDHFPSLEELYVADMEIDSIEFVEKLPNLQYLDITKNNVTSLMPLANLSNFRAVWCGYNTILEPLPEDSNIQVDMESYYSPY